MEIIPPPTQPAQISLLSHQRFEIMANLDKQINELLSTEISDSMVFLEEKIYEILDQTDKKIKIISINLLNISSEDLIFVKNEIYKIFYKKNKKIQKVFANKNFNLKKNSDILEFIQKSPGDDLKNLIKILEISSQKRTILFFKVSNFTDILPPNYLPKVSIYSLNFPNFSKILRNFYKFFLTKFPIYLFPSRKILIESKKINFSAQNFIKIFKFSLFLHFSEEAILLESKLRNLLMSESEVIETLYETLPKNPESLLKARIIMFPYFYEILENLNLTPFEEIVELLNGKLSATFSENLSVSAEKFEQVLQHVFNDFPTLKTRFYSILPNYTANAKKLPPVSSMTFRSFVLNFSQKVCPAENFWPEKNLVFYPNSFALKKNNFSGISQIFSGNSSKILKNLTNPVLSRNCSHELRSEFSENWVLIFSLLEKNKIYTFDEILLNFGIFAKKRGFSVAKIEKNLARDLIEMEYFGAIKKKGTGFIKCKIMD